MPYFIIGGDGKEYGPKPDSEVREWIAEGRLNTQSQIREQSDPNWRALEDFPEFANYLFGATPSTPTPSAPAIQQHQQPYPQYGYQEQSTTNGMAITGMVMGILSILSIYPCCGIPFNILGIIFSSIGLKQIKSNQHQGGRGMAIAGLICSIISLVLLVVFIGLGIAVGVSSP